MNPSFDDHSLSTMKLLSIYILLVIGLPKSKVTTKNGLQLLI